MASKQPFKLFDIKKMALRTFLKSKDFIKHNIFMQKKNILIIGDTKSEFYNQFTNKLSSRWSVNSLNQSTYFKYSQEEMIVKYKQAEKQFQKTIYEAIVVLPQIQTKDNKFNFQDQGLATKFPNYFLNSIFRNVLAYKLASRHLSKTGVIVLSCNQKEFYNLKPFQHQQQGRGRIKMQLKENPYNQYCISNCLSDGAVTYLGLILGERYQLDLNSHSVVALSNEQSFVEQEAIAKLYAEWVNHKDLPQPGSFARFISVNQKVVKPFVEYL